jgi:tetratricopeptide (TPR) repeat protein
MSLIVQALKRAQEGATRRLPPLSGRQTRGPFPPALSDGDGRTRTMALVGLVIGAVIVGGAGLWVARGSAKGAPTAKTPPQLMIVEPVAASVPGAPTPVSEAGTSIEEVRAALLAAQPLETAAVAENVVEKDAAEPPAKPSQAQTRSTKPAESRGWTARPVPPRVDPVTPVRAESTPYPIDVPVVRSEPRLAAPPIPAPAPPPAAREASAVVKVHSEPSKEAAEALAAGVKNQQGGQPAKAIEEYQRGIRADSRNPGLYNNLGVALRDSGRLDEATEAFQAALNIDPKYEKALNNLGVSRYQQGNYADAVDLFSQVLRINPANVESSINLGMIYFLAQRWDEALSAFQQALKYNPRSAEAHYNLGLFWERHGDHEKALQAYRKFIELAGVPHAALAARVTEHVRQMERGK